MNQAKRSALSRSRTTRAVVLGALLLDLLVAGMAWRVLRADRRAAFAAAERSGENLARVLAENLEGTIARIDLALHGCADALGDGRAIARLDEGPQAAAVVARTAARIPFLEAIRVADASGRVVMGPGVDPARPVSTADRDYFRVARDDASGRMAVSSPLFGRISGRWSINFARAIRAADGSFVGVVFAVAPLDQFTRTLAHVEVGPDGAVVLRKADHAMVARYPEVGDPAQLIGQRRVSDRLRSIAESSVTEQTFVARSPIDGKEKMNAFRRVDGSPFYLLVAQSTDELLAHWRHEAWRTTAAVALFVLATAIAGWAALTSLRKESEARFRTLVLDAPVAVALTSGSRVVFANHAFARTLGLGDPQAAIDVSIVDHVHPADVPRFAERMDRRLRGQPVEPTMELTLLRGDGSSFRAAVTDAAVDFGGRPAIVGFVQDVTERSRADAERERLISQLQHALAEVKTLSGLLPICAHCKKIRDDRGYWSRIETYIRERSNAEFTHGICPDCARRYFGEEIRDGDEESSDAVPPASPAGKPKGQT